MPHLEHSRGDVCPAADGRLVIVGDVHGCDVELRKLLDHVRFRDGTDALVLVGDLVNKGPGSAEVVRLARNMGACCVRGNHDDQLLEAWHRVGRYEHGVEKYASKHLLDELSASDIKWVQELPLSISFPWLSLVVVHAGLVPGLPLESQSFRDMLWMRDVTRHSRGDDSSGNWRGLQQPSKAGQSWAWASLWPGPEHVVFGHDAKRKLQRHEFATGLDTGCCYGFQLSALVVPADGGEHTLAQVQADRVYAKPNLGS